MGFAIVKESSAEHSLRPTNKIFVNFFALKTRNHLHFFGKHCIFTLPRLFELKIQNNSKVATVKQALKCIFLGKYDC